MFHYVSINEHKTNIHKTTVEYTKKHNHEPVTRAALKLWWNLKGGVFCAKYVDLVGRGRFMGFWESIKEGAQTRTWSFENQLRKSHKARTRHKSRRTMNPTENLEAGMCQIFGFGQKGTSYLEIGRSRLTIQFWEGLELNYLEFKEGD